MIINNFLKYFFILQVIVLFLLIAFAIGMATGRKEFNALKKNQLENQINKVIKK